MTKFRKQYTWDMISMYIEKWLIVMLDVNGLWHNLLNTWALVCLPRRCMIQLCDRAQCSILMAVFFAVSGWQDLWSSEEAHHWAIVQLVQRSPSWSKDRGGLQDAKATENYQRRSHLHGQGTGMFCTLRLCVCVCVCLCVCVRACVCVCTYMYIYICVVF